MKNKSLIILLLAGLCSQLPAMSHQFSTETKEMKLIEKNGMVKKVTVKLPTIEKSDNASSWLDSDLEKVTQALKDNGFDCPPKRQKESDNVWVCGNGKKVQATDKRVQQILNQLWKKETK